MPSPHGPTISSGRLRGRRLSVPEGLVTRPTRSLVRQALFNMLGERVRGATVLDLYSGSGSLGLEAFSRGAERIVFVEHDRRALAALRDNLARCTLAAPVATILAADAARLTRLPAGPFDLVFADPPFALRNFLPAGLEEPGALSAGATLVVHAPSERGPPRTERAWRLLRSRTHGRSVIHLFERDSA